MTGISKMLGFIAMLRNNNNRNWFSSRKSEYEAIRNECYREIEVLISRISEFDEKLIGLEPEDCTYRIYRDVRFSADKSPYKTHFGIVLGKGGKKCREAGYYLHIEPGQCAFYGGVWFPEQLILNRLRHDIDDNIEEFLEIIGTPAFREKFPELVGDSLKSMPKGFDKALPHGNIIKKKEYLVMEPLSDSYFSSEGWQDGLASDALLMKPFLDFLNYTFDDMRDSVAL